MEESAGRIIKIEQEVRLRATPEKVFAAMTTELGDWWPFRFKPEGKVVVEAKVGGRLYEDWGNDTGALYATIVYIDPPTKLVGHGGGAMNRGMTSYDVHTFEADGEFTNYKKSMSMWGNVTEEMENMFTTGSKAIVQEALRAWVEEGKGYQI